MAITHVASASNGATGTTNAVTTPPGTLRNDVILAFVWLPSTVVTVTPPGSGWLEIQNPIFATTYRARAYWKLDDGSIVNPTAQTWTFSAGVASSIVSMSWFRGVHLSSPINNFNDNQGGPSTTYSTAGGLPLLDSLATVAAVCAFAGDVGGAATADGPLTQIAANSEGALAAVVGWEIVTVAQGVRTATGPSANFDAQTIYLRPYDTEIGHKLDASTVALWRFDEVAATSGEANSLLDAIGPGTRTLTVPGGFAPCASTYLVGSSNLLSRKFGRFNKMTKAGDAASVTALLGDWTIEFFIKWLRNTAETQFVVTYGGAGEASPENFQGSVRISSAGVVQAFWESGAGVDELVVPTSGMTLVVGTVHHVAVVKDSVANTVLFYLDGVQQGAAVAYTNEPTGGAGTVEWNIGGVPGGAAPTNYLVATLRSVHVSNVVRTAGVIAANAALRTTTIVHATDGSTFAHWIGAEIPDVYDLTNNGHHLRVVGTTPTVYDPLVDAGQSRLLVADVTEFVHVSDPTFLTMLKGSWTFEAWVVPRASSFNRGLFAHGDPSVETAADNVTGIDLTTTEIRFLSESGAGVDATFTTSDLYMIQASGSGVKHHIAVRKTSTGTYTVDFFWDGVLVDISGALVEYTGGENGFIRLCNSPGTSGVPHEWAGIIDDVRISNIARTNAEIKESYERGEDKLSLPWPSAPSQAAFVAALSVPHDAAPNEAVHGHWGAKEVFVMRAYKTSPTTGHVYWEVFDEPDIYATQSGYLFSELTDILVAARYFPD
jgi:hypothetical protein